MFQFPANPTNGQQFSPGVGLTYEFNGTGWVFVGMTAASLYPAGIILPYAGIAPLPFQGWVLCDGFLYATSSYPALFAVIGYTYGGSGANFNVPDLRGRVVAGLDNMGGVRANRLGDSLSPNAMTMGAAGGAEGAILATSDLPAHAHGITDVAHSHGVNDPTHGHAVSDPTHTHGVSDPTHTHGVGGGGDHTHGINRERNQWNSDNPTTYIGAYHPDTRIRYESGTGVTMLQYYGTSGASSGVVSISGNYTGIGISVAATGILTQGSGTGVTVQSSGSGLSTTNNTGGGAPHLNVQPTMTMNFIIKA